MKTILIVDDINANIGLLVDHLQDLDVRVLVAQDGIEALQRADAVLPDLILLDVLMPGMDGFETCRRLKVNERTREIPVIFMTALSETSDKITGFDAGGVDYVTKPFQMTEVVARVRTHLALRQANQELETTLKALKNVQAELICTARMASLTSLVAGMAHQLNTPIGTGLTVASSLLDETLNLVTKIDTENSIKRSELTHYLKRAEEAGMFLVSSLKRSAKLVDSFKQVSVENVSAQNRCIFSLRDVVTESWKALCATLDCAGVIQTQDICPDLQFNSYPSPMSQVIFHLLENAVIHGFDGKAGGVIQISAQKLGSDQVGLTIQDNGRGIAENNIDRVFEPFFTTRLGMGGSGLGLAISHAIVTGVLGGKISVQSEVDVGSQVLLVLPLIPTSGSRQ